MVSVSKTWTVTSIFQTVIGELENDRHIILGHVVHCSSETIKVARKSTFLEIYVCV